MLILAVDTNSPAGSVAILRDRRLLAEVNLDSPQTHSERLLPSIDLLLNALGIGLLDIDGFALAVGPGSFTGIRIGMSTVKSLAFPSRRPIAAVSNLEALALKIKQPQARLLCPLMDAKMNEVYSALFEAQAGGLQEIIPQGIYTPDGLFSGFPAHRIITFIGSGVPVYRDRLSDYFKDRARLSRRSLHVGYEVGLLGYERLKSGQGLDSFQVEPLYFRRSQAEEKHR
ncbi:MAG: tRNA (adenosine(37)-N6)-threonylcarbamoyltransferase complex dimerization subunit type 1 TsaB [Candidatus Aminicenantaceae bacterium]